jgi:hypothetical protein
MIFGLYMCCKDDRIVYIFLDQNFGSEQKILYAVYVEAEFNQLAKLRKLNTIDMQEEPIGRIKILKLCIFFNHW